MNTIREFLERYIKITDEDWAFFSSKIIEVNYKKKDIILEAGEVEDYISIVKSGIGRLYLPKENGERTVKFAFEKEFFTSFHSFHTKKPSKFTMEALTDITLWRINFDDVQKTYEVSFLANVLGRKIVETLYLKRLEREFLHMNYSPEEKYKMLVKEYPHYIQLISGKHIASFIGITPEALSRIRSRIY